VLAANNELFNVLQINNPSCIQGLRPGEILHCIHHNQGPGGCGTSKACRSCGAVIAILASLEKDEIVESECHITSVKNSNISAVEFKIRATPLHIQGRKLLVFVLYDISDSKRREVLQNIFIHDISNTAIALKAWSELLSYDDPEIVAENIVLISEEMTDIIEGQRLLLSAESGKLTTMIEPMEVSSLFTILQRHFEAQKITKDKRLIANPPQPGSTINTDIRLLKRILINMILNALEATEPKGIVTITYVNDNNHTIHVHNAAFIPEEIALHIFERSFSTKQGIGHGLGTYCMKLLGEQFLGGKVLFTTHEETGTCFSIILP
jgi:signal transduction histidine kinase